MFAANEKNSENLIDYLHLRLLDFLFDEIKQISYSENNPKNYIFFGSKSFPLSQKMGLVRKKLSYKTRRRQSLEWSFSVLKEFMGRVDK